MFPIRSVQGDVIGFGGRVLDRGEPKYLNSPETPVFSKGRELYGLFEGRAAMRQRGYALVVEGYMDVVALAQSGFGNAVATLGTACTADHVQKLFRFTDSVVFSFDGDAAGRRAARRALEASLPHASDTRTIRFLFLPPEHDPDSYVREHGARGLRGLHRAGGAAVAPARRGRRRRLRPGHRRGPGAHAAPTPGRCGRPCPTARSSGSCSATWPPRAATIAGQLLRQWGHARQRRPHGARERGPPAATRRSRAVSGHGQPARPRGLAAAAAKRDCGPSSTAKRTTSWQRRPRPTTCSSAASSAACTNMARSRRARCSPSCARTSAQDSGGAAVLSRIAAFHDPEPDSDIARELSLVIAKLRLQAVDDELKLLFDSGAQSPDAQRRSRELMDARKAAEGLAAPGGRMARRYNPRLT